MRSLSLFPVIASAPWRNFTESTDELELFVPVARVEEANDSYRIEVDVPGLKKDELKIETDNRILSIGGERKNRYRIKKQFNLPDDVDLDGIKAKHEDGVLFLELPKAAHLKPRSIEIK